MNNKTSRLGTVSLASLLITSGLIWSATSFAQSANLTISEDESLADIAARIPDRGGIYRKVAHDLVSLQDNYLSVSANKPAGTLDPTKPVSQFMSIANGYVVIDAVAASNPAQLSLDLSALGAIDVGAYGSVVSAKFPIALVERLADLQSLRYVRPSYAIANTGSVTSQGDAAQLSDVLRTNQALDGTGVTVGVMSDSFNCDSGQAADIASGDLPATINNLQDNCPNSDEGRGMAQLVYDVAPGSGIAFHTAFGGQAIFAQGITDLVTAGAHVIVDDVFNFGEPMFMDGIIAQAADAAAAAGVPYFSSAGNSDVNSYESPFVERGSLGLLGGMTHDFDPGPGASNLQQITVPVGASLTMTFQWNQPFFSVSGGPGATTDLDIFLVGADQATPLAFGITDNTASGDPIEVFSFENTGFDLDGTPGNDTTFFILIENAGGPNPTEMKYAFSDGGSGVSVDTFDTSSGPSYGHSSAAGVASVGAAAYFDTPAFGTNPPALESFSSRANVPIHFDTAGTAISPPQLRLKPEFTAPDGGNTTFFGNDIGLDPDTDPNFFGTSAAAPHAAGVAALLLESDGTLTPAEIYAALEASAIDILPAGFDFDSGHGLIEADTAFNSLSNTAPTLDPIGSQQGVTGQQLVFNLVYADAESATTSITLTQTGMPGFCAFNPDTDGSGDITCNITANDSGRYAIAVTATDDGEDAGAGVPSRTASQGFYVIANENTEPTLTPFSNDQQMNDNDVLVIPLAGSDADANDVLTFGAVDAPGFCVTSTTSPGVGDITCTPGYNNTGVYVVGAQVVDDGTPPKADSNVFILSVNNVNRDPVLAAIGPQNVDEGQQLIINGSATDPDIPDSLTFDSDEPDFCVAVDNFDGTGTMTCNPGFTDAGVYNITVTVDDAFGGSDNETFALTVNDVNRPPELQFIGNHVVANNAQLVINLSSSDPDGNNVQLSGAVPGFCVSNYTAGATGSITCNPTGAGDNGTYPVTITATDDGVGGLTDDETFSIVVGGAGTLNNAPVLNPVGNQSVADTAVLVISLSSSDGDGNSMSFVDTSGLPAFCVLNDGDGAGNITCSPTFGDEGVYQANVRVTDDGVPNLTDVEQISITVSHLNAAPVADAGPDQILDTLTFVLLDGTNSTDAETPSVSLQYSWRVVAKPPGSTLTDGAIFDAQTSVPSFIADVDGTYIFELKVTDEGFGVDVDTVTVVADTPKWLFFGDGLNAVLEFRNTANGSLIASGAVTLSGSTVSATNAIAVDPQTNTMYGALKIAGQQNFEFVTLDPLSGVATGIGDMGERIAGLTFAPDGTLFAVTGSGGATPETLFTVDKDTGALTFVMTLDGGMGEAGEAIEYNSDDDLIYHASGSTFESIDPVMASRTDIGFSGDIPGPGSYRVLGLVYDERQGLFLGSRIDAAGGTYFTLTTAGVVTDVTVFGDTRWYRGHAFWDPSFQAPTSVATSGDHGGDGKADILWRNGANGQNALWEQDGGNLLANSAVPTTSDLDWQIVGDGDYNGDGNQDILWRNIAIGNGQMAIWLMDSGVRIANIALPRVSNANWTVVGDGDYNGDGVSDILWRNIVSGQNAIWQINNGAMTANLAVNAVSNLNWVPVGDGDYTGDGKSDILWRNMSNGQNALWAMDGAAREFNLLVPAVTDTNWAVVGDGDHNGDGKADILWRHVTQGWNASWTMDGNVRTGNYSIDQVSNLNWQVIGNKDYDGDGMADIVWANSSTGDVVFWGMDGTGNRIAHEGIDTLTDSNWGAVNLN